MEENKKDLPIEQDRHIGGCDLQKKETAFMHEELFCDSCNIIEQSQAAVCRSVNEILVKRNWLLGKYDTVRYGKEI